MRLRARQAGFSAVEVVVVLVVLVALGFGVYSVYDRQQDKKNKDSTAQQTSAQSSNATDVQAAPEIKSTDDLDKAEATLDATDPDSSSDAAALDSESSDF